MNQVSRLALGWLMFLALPSFHAQQHIHLVGAMPTLDVGMPLGDHWHLENYSFACVLPFEQSRPSFSNAAVMENFGPGSEVEDGRAIRSLVFAYTEFDLTRALSDAWSVTGSYTHEWVPSTSHVQGAGERYIRNEHRLWLQSKYQSNKDADLSWWWRMRWDQRWIESDPFNEVAEPWTSRPRVREQLGCALPLGGGTLAASAEFFVEAWDRAQLSSPLDRFREAWTTLQYGASLSESVRWEAGPLVVSWKQFGDDASRGWAHFWYVQATAFVTIGS